MTGFIDAALGFPAVVFSFALLVVVAYWAVALLGGFAGDAHHHSGDGHDVGHDAGHAADHDAGDDGPHGFAGLLAAAGLGGVPATVSLSLLIALTWFASLVATVLLDGLHRTGAPTLVTAPLAALALLVAVLVGWLATRLLVRPLRRIWPDVRPPSRHGFVGLTCVVRTGRVDAGFGQAEVTSPDGSSAVIQVRQTDDVPLTAGSTALIFDYDSDGEFFRVMPYGQQPAL